MLFNDQYPYRSSQSTTMRHHFKKIATDIISETSYNPIKVLEIGCILPDHYVTTNLGLVKTENIKVGDIVLTHKNKFENVTEIFSRNYKGKVYNIKLKSLNTSLEITNEHPILTENGWKKANDLKVNDKIATQSYFPFTDKKILDIYLEIGSEHNLNLKLDNDFITFTTNGLKNKIPRYINLSSEFYSIAGYFIGEGSTSNKTTIEFSFSKKEENKVLEIQKYFHDIFHLNGEIRKQINVISIRFNSKILYLLFGKLFGRGSHNKKIPLLFNNNKISYFLKSLWFTDGHKSIINKKNKRNIYIYSSVSRLLILQLKDLLNTIGINCSIQLVRNDRGFSKKNGFIYRLTIQKKTDVSLFESVIYDNNILDIKTCYDYKSINSISHRYYDGLVYNLHIKNDNSYVVDGITTHNCNDGAFLKCFDKENCVGVEPCANFAKELQDEGYRIESVFWNKTTAQEIVDKYGKFDVVYSANCFCHIQDIINALESVKMVLSNGNSICILEDPSLLSMIQLVSYDQIYDEHAHIFSVTALNNICKMIGLTITKVEKISVHGFSNRICISKDSFDSQTLKDALAEESLYGIDNLSTYHEFNDRVNQSKRRLVHLLDNESRIVVGYGATSKATVVLNFCDLNKYITTFTDTTPEKIGKYMPGTNIPIIDRDKYTFDSKKHLVFLGAWNYINEIRSKESAFVYNGGEFITHIPYPRIV